MPGEIKEGAEREHPQSHLIHTLCAVIVIALILLDDLVLGISELILGPIPFWVRLIPFGITIGIALFLMIRSHQILFGPEEHGPSHLVTMSIFAYTRNPMYLAILLIHLSFILLWMSLIALAAWVGVIIVYNRLVAYEEQILEEMFGQEWREYKQKVPRWILIK